MRPMQIMKGADKKSGPKPSSIEETFRKSGLGEQFRLLITKPIKIKVDAERQHSLFKEKLSVVYCFI